MAISKPISHIPAPLSEVNIILQLKNLIIHLI
jgi:hypothetical protein